MARNTPEWKGLGTRAMHAGYSPDPTTGAHAVPLYQTAAYQFQDAQHAAQLFALNELGNIYSRLTNPTVHVLEERLSAVEGGLAALALSSGQQAVMVAIANLAATEGGRHIVAASAMYGGTMTLLGPTLGMLGIETTFVDMTSPKNVARAIRPETRAVYIESVANPKNDVLDYEKIVETAHAADVPVVCDNTVLTPALFRPIDYGVDIVVYSLTKFINGHGNSIGGAIVDSGRFDWKKRPERWPQFTEPHPLYHGDVFADKFGPLCYMIAARAHWLRDLGGALSPFNAYLTLIGLETLHLRMPRHCENALALAGHLEKHPAVTGVNYPGLASHPDHTRAKQYLPRGAGAILGFNIRGGRDAARQFIESVQLATHVTNLGDAKTIVSHPASTTHSQLSSEDLLKAGIRDDFVRVSVGIEDIDDIVTDFDQALATSQS